MKKIFGREEEREKLRFYYGLENSEFLVVYGRRRVGKTYLIREFFAEKFCFYLTGLANASTEQQLLNFQLVINEQSNNDFPCETSWLLAFEQLKLVIQKSQQKKKVIFIDEMPWLDIPKSDFLTAFEHFWNHFCAARNDILLIACGSATSWLTNKIFNNKGGLHNRVTRQMEIMPFTLSECETYLASKNIIFERYQIVESYMILGGIPYYLSLMEKGKSFVQNIDLLFFDRNPLLKNEFQNLYASLFRHAENHIAVVEALSKKIKGLTRDEISKATKLTSGGGLTKVLFELENCGFIRQYQTYNNKNTNALYQLADFYTLFYFQFIKNQPINDENYWLHTIDSPKHRAWSGFAFERVCLAHSTQIKKALGISGVKTYLFSWKSKDTENQTQIDLCIDRNDQVINLCEMKFSVHEFTIDKGYSENLRRKIGIFKTETKTKKAVHLTMITTFGLTENEYALNLVQTQVSMKGLFES
jgi:AAA+ ATPase superfamily predicted ATPase